MTTEKIRTTRGPVSADGVIRTAADKAYFGSLSKRRLLMTSSSTQNKKRNPFLVLLGSLAIVVGLLFGAAPASADAAAPTSGVAVSVSSSSAEDSVKVSSVVSSDVKGKVNLEFIIAKGVKAKAAKKYTCTVSKRGPTKKQLKSCKVLILKKGTKFVNSGRNRTGQVVYYQDITKTTDKFVKKNGTWLRAKCGNYVKFYVQKIKVPTLKVSQVHLVKSFQSVRAKIAITAKAKATAKATAWCTTAGSSASASASASGQGSVTIYVVAKARTASKAKAKIEGSASLRAQARNEALVRAKASASAKAKASASAQTTCSSNTTPVDSTPDGDLIAPQHLYVGGGTATYRAYGWDAEDGSNVTLSISVSGAATGGTTVRDYISDGRKVKEFLITAGDTPGLATITLTVKDTKGNTSTFTQSFPVKADEF